MNGGGLPAAVSGEALRPFVRDTELAARLGCRPWDINAEAREPLSSVLDVCVPRYVWRPVTFQVEEGGVTFPFGFVASAPLARLLCTAKEGYLLAATLGHEVDAFLRRAAVRSASAHFLADAAASAAADGLCDLAVTALPDKRLTPRFSPGYGGWPLSGQRQVLSFLRAGELLGIRLTESGLMLPTKTVTAVTGVCYD